MLGENITIIVLNTNSAIVNLLEKPNYWCQTKNIVNEEYCDEDRSANSTCVCKSHDQYSSVLMGALNQQDRTQREVKM